VKMKRGKQGLKSGVVETVTLLPAFAGMLPETQSDYRGACHIPRVAVRIQESLPGRRWKMASTPTDRMYRDFPP
jgi:hypothetical protein